MIPHPTQNITTLTLTSAPTNQNTLAWATLHFAILYHCISSVLCCNQNTNFMQGPKNGYTHTYSHPLSNLSSSQLPAWSLSVFCLLNFLVFILAQLFLVNWQHIIGAFTRIWLFSQTTLQKTQYTLHILELIFFIFLSRASMALWQSIGIVVFGWSILLTLQHSAVLCPYLPQLWHFLLNFPLVMPNSIGSYPLLSYYIGIKTGYFNFFFFFWA